MEATLLGMILPCSTLSPLFICNCVLHEKACDSYCIIHERSDISKRCLMFKKRGTCGVFQSYSELPDSSQEPGVPGRPQLKKENIENGNSGGKNG